MPEDTPQVAKMSASITGGESGADYPPVGIRCEMEVNRFPIVTATVAVPEGGEDVSVKAPVSQEVIERISGLQTARLEGRQEPDFLLNAEDGLGGSMSYDGFISAPVLELTTASSPWRRASASGSAGARPRSSPTSLR